MKKSPIVLSSLASLALSCSAAAAELTPLQGGTFALGDHTASVYYTVRGGLYEVVTTIAPDSELGGAPMRFVGSLAVGQKYIVSLGQFGTTATPRTLELVHNGDHLAATVVDTQIAAR